MTDAASPAPSRHAAGEDPAKRSQILAGAHAVFTRLGFDAASMRDIAAEAGVSKGTLYVYFENKEDLFRALVCDARERSFQGLAASIAAGADVRERLTSFGLHMAGKLCSDDVVRAQRIVLGICERKPEIGREMIEAGYLRARRLLAEVIAAAQAVGELGPGDPERLATQFAELATAGLYRPRLFGAMAAPPSQAELAATVGAAVDLLLAACPPVRGKDDAEGAR